MGGFAPNPLIEKDGDIYNMYHRKEPTKSIFTRVTLAEKERIARKAARCGISVSEYIRQRCLGYEPRAIPPDAFYELCDKLDAARTADNSAAVLEVLDALRETVISPGRDG